MLLKLPDNVQDLFRVKWVLCIKYHLQPSKNLFIHPICLPNSSLNLIPLNRAANLLGGDKTNRLLL